MCGCKAHTRPQILQFNGVRISDFPDQNAALQATDRLIAHNMAEYGHAGTKHEGTDPLFQKFLYIRSGGTKRAVEVADTKSDAVETDVKGTGNESAKRRMVDSGFFEEALGPSSASSGGGGIKVEFVGHGRLLERTASLRCFVYAFPFSCMC